MKISSLLLLPFGKVYGAVECKNQHKPIYKSLLTGSKRTPNTFTTVNRGLTSKN